MTDFDADEKVLPLEPRRIPFGLRSDHLLSAAGVLLALGAAFFPWYAFVNPERFGYHVESVVLSRDLPELPSRAIVSASPAAIPDSDAAYTQSLVPDNIQTGTVPEEQTQEHKRVDTSRPVEDPVLPNKAFRLLHVANGQAMIENSSGIFLVKTGSALPDDSHLATIEKRSGQWVIVTDTGKVISAGDVSAPAK